MIGWFHVVRRPWHLWLNVWLVGGVTLWPPPPAAVAMVTAVHRVLRRMVVWPVAAAMMIALCRAFTIQRRLFDDLKKPRFVVHTQSQPYLRVELGVVIMVGHVPRVIHVVGRETILAVRHPLSSVAKSRAGMNRTCPSP